MINAKSTARNLKISEVSSKDLKDGCLIVHDGKLHELAIAMFDDDSGKTLSVMGLKDLATDDVVTLDLSTNFDDPIQILGEGVDFIFKQNLFNVEIVSSLESVPTVLAGSAVEFARHPFIAELQGLINVVNKRIHNNQPKKIIDQALFRTIDVRNGYETYTWEVLIEHVHVYSSSYSYTEYETVNSVFCKNAKELATVKPQDLVAGLYLHTLISSRCSTEKTAKARFKARQTRNAEKSKLVKVY